MFEIELIICIKVDLALNKLQRLICHKTNQPTNQPRHFVTFTCFSFVFSMKIQKFLKFLIFCRSTSTTLPESLLCFRILLLDLFQLTHHAPFNFANDLKSLNSMCMYLFNPLRTSMMRCKVIFTRSLIGLNSEFFFSSIGCHAQNKENSLSYYLLIAGGRIHIAGGFDLSPYKGY